MEFFRSNLYVGLNKEWLRSLGDAVPGRNWLEPQKINEAFALMFSSAGGQQQSITRAQVSHVELCKPGLVLRCLGLVLYCS